MKHAILLLLIAALLTGCGSTPEAGSDTTTSDTTTADVTTEVTLFSDLPTGDFGGYTFKILGLDNESEATYVQMTAEEMNGEIINDVVFERNRKIEDELNIKISYIGASASSITQTARASILAGNDEYDILFDQTLKLGPASADQIFLNINEMDGINLEKPWWNNTLAEQLSIGGKKYMLVGDLNYQYLYNVWSLFFNQQTIDDYELESPFSLVTNGKWTIDKMVEYCRTVAQDVNSDGSYRLLDDDICGFVTNTSCFFALLYGAGGELIQKDGDLPVFKGATDKMTEVYDKLLSVTTDPRVYNSYGSLGLDERFGRFANGQFLFSGMMVGSAKYLRDMQADFGVVPFPKLDETQETYYSYAGPSMSTMAIPATATDPERTGIILENLSAHSYGTLRTAYFETTMKDKFMRDEASVEMLDYLYSGIRMDLGYVYGFGGVQNIFMNTLRDGGGIVSALASVEPAVNEAIDTYIENISK